MERTTKSQRRLNAQHFFQNDWTRAVVVIERKESKTNPNINRCALLTNKAGYNSAPVVIGEGIDGVYSAMHEFLKFVDTRYALDAVSLLYDRGKMNDELKKSYGFRITYDDGYAMIFER